MSYCINPYCRERENPEHLEVCHYCGTSLIIHDHYRLLRPLRPPDARSHTEVFEVVNQSGIWSPWQNTWMVEPGTHQVMKVLKSSDPKLVELMEREALVLQSLDCPGVPRCDIDALFTVTLDSRTELHCLVLEKIEGQNLEEWLEVHPPPSQSVAIDWLKQLVGMLDGVHQAGFFHRDIKPSNIILRPDGQLSLVDFGSVREVSDTYLAKVSSERSQADGLYEVTVVRTTGYAPMEQVNGKAVPQSDFYALGRSFVRLLTGVSLINLPEDPETGALLWRKRAPQVDKPLADLIDWLMAPVPGKRPQNTRVILDYLNTTLPRRMRLLRIVRSRTFKLCAIAVAAGVSIALYQSIQSFRFWIHYQMGLENQNQGFYEASIEEFQKALDIKPQSVETRSGLGLSCFLIKNIACATEQYRIALELDPTYWIAHYNLASLYDDLGQYDRAESQYKLAMEYNQDRTALPLNNLSRLRSRAGKFQSAAQLAEQGLKQTDDPDQRASLYKNLGWAQFGLQNFQQAQQSLKTSIDLNGDQADAYCLLAQVLEAQQQLVQADQQWQECVRKNSSNPEVAEWRTQLFKRLRDRNPNGLN